MSDALDPRYIEDPYRTVPVVLPYSWIRDDLPRILLPIMRARGVGFRSDPLTPNEFGEVQRLLSTAAPRGKISKPGDCYRNAATLAFAAEARGMELPLLYAEGVGSICGGRSQHAWCVLNGKVIDLTWRLGRRGPGARRAGIFRDRVMGVIPNPADYFGVVLTMDELREAYESGSPLPGTPLTWFVHLSKRRPK